MGCLLALSALRKPLHGPALTCRAQQSRPHLTGSSSEQPIQKQAGGPARLFYCSSSSVTPVFKARWSTFSSVVLHSLPPRTERRIILFSASSFKRTHKCCLVENRSVLKLSRRTQNTLFVTSLVGIRDESYPAFNPSTVGRDCS